MMRLYNSYQDITSGTDSIIWRALNKSIENNSKETFFVLISFIRKILELSIKKNSIKHFQQFILFS